MTHHTAIPAALPDARAAMVAWNRVAIANHSEPGTYKVPDTQV